MVVKQTWNYKIFKRYLRLIHETLLVRNRYVISRERLPKYGDRFFIVCNHQNTANDPLNILFSLPLSYHVCALARANVFSVHPLATRFLHWIGLLPAFRLGWEGGTQLEDNYESFHLVADRINSGYPVIVFPEAGHTQGHYLDRFTTGSVRMAFQAAAEENFTHDVKIVPTAHHYSDFFDVQTDFVWMIGEPVSLQPYYREYQEHPNSVMRDITKQIRHQIQQMMLDEGIDDYETKDFLRRSALNEATAKDMPLPLRLEADKAFVAQLRDNPHYDQIIQRATQLNRDEQAIGTDDITVSNKPSWVPTLLKTVMLIVLLPLWIVSLWPHLVCYALPPRFIKSDKMFVNSYRFIMSALFLYPLLAVLTLLIAAITGWWWQSLIWIMLWIPTGRFCWWYYSIGRKTLRCLRCLTHPRAVRNIEQQREAIKELL